SAWSLLRLARDAPELLELEAEADDRPGVASEALERLDLVHVELVRAALVDHLDDAEDLLLVDHRGREERAHLVPDGRGDLLEEARVLVDVGDDDDLLVREGRPGHALAGLDRDVEREDLARLGS